MATSFEGRAFATTRSTGDANTQLAQAVFVGKDDNGDRVDFTDTDTVVMTLTSAATEGTISSGEPILSKTFSGEALFETSRITADFVFNHTKNREYTITFSIFAENQAVARTSGTVTDTYTFVEAPKLVGTDSTNPGGSLSVDTSSSDDKLTLKVKNTPFTHASDSDNDVAKVEITAVTVVAEVSEGADAQANSLVGKEIRRRYVLPNYDTVIDTATKTANYDLTSITGRDDATAEEIITFDFTSDSVGLNAAQDNVVALTFADENNTALSILNGQKYDLTFIIDTPGGSLTINPSGTQLITADPNPQTITATTATTAEGLGALEMTITDTDFIVDADLTELIVNLYKGDATTPTSTVTFSTADGTDTEKKLETLQINRGNTLATATAPKVNLLFLENDSTSATDMTVSQDTVMHGEKRAVVTLPQSQFTAGDSFKIGIITKNATDNPVTVQNGFEDNGDSKGEFTLTNLRDGVNFTTTTGGQRSLTIPDAVPETTPSNTFAQPTAVSTSTLDIADPPVRADGNAELKATLEAKNIEKAFYNGSTKVTNVFDLDTHPEVDFTDLRLDLIVRENTYVNTSDANEILSYWDSYTTNLTLAKDDGTNYTLKNGSTNVGTVTMQDNFARQILKIPSNNMASATAFPDAADHKLVLPQGENAPVKIDLTGNNLASGVEFQVVHSTHGTPSPQAGGDTIIVFSFTGTVPTGKVTYESDAGVTDTTVNATVELIDKYPKIELDLLNGTPTTEGIHPNTLSLARVVGVINTDDFTRAGNNLTALTDFDRTAIASTHADYANRNTLIMKSGSWATLQATLRNKYGDATSPMITTKQNLDLTPGKFTASAPIMDSTARGTNTMVFTFLDAAEGLAEGDIDPRKVVTKDADGNVISTTYVELTTLVFEFKVHAKGTDGSSAVRYKITKTADEDAASAVRFANITRGGAATDDRTYAITIQHGTTADIINSDDSLTSGTMTINDGDILEFVSMHSENGYGTGTKVEDFTYGTEAGTTTVMMEGTVQLGMMFTQTDATKKAANAFTKATILEALDETDFPSSTERTTTFADKTIGGGVSLVNGVKRYTQNDNVSYVLDKFLTATSQMIIEDGVPYELKVQGVLHTVASGGTPANIGPATTIQQRVAHVKTATNTTAGITTQDLGAIREITHTLADYVDVNEATYTHASLKFTLDATYKDQDTANLEFESIRIPIVAERPSLTIKTSLNNTVDSSGNLTTILRSTSLPRASLVNGDATQRPQVYTELQLTKAQTKAISTIDKVVVELAAAPMKLLQSLDLNGKGSSILAEKNSTAMKWMNATGYPADYGTNRIAGLADPYGVSLPTVEGTLTATIKFDDCAGNATMLTPYTPGQGENSILELLPYEGDWLTTSDSDNKFGVPKMEITKDNYATYFKNNKTWDEFKAGNPVLVSFPLHSNLVGLQIFARAYIMSSTPTDLTDETGFSTGTALESVSNMLSGNANFEDKEVLQYFSTGLNVSNYDSGHMSDAQNKILNGLWGAFGAQAGVEVLKLVESVATSVTFTMPTIEISTNSDRVFADTDDSNKEKLINTEYSAFAADTNGMSASKSIALNATEGIVQVVNEDTSATSTADRSGFESFDQLQSGLVFLASGGIGTEKMEKTTIYLTKANSEVKLQYGSNTSDQITLKVGTSQYDTTAGVTTVADLIDYTKEDDTRDLTKQTGALSELSVYNTRLRGATDPILGTNSNGASSRFSVSVNILANAAGRNNAGALEALFQSKLGEYNGDAGRIANLHTYQLVETWGHDNSVVDGNNTITATKLFPGDLDGGLTFLPTNTFPTTVTNFESMHFRTVDDQSGLKVIVYFDGVRNTQNVRVYLRGKVNSTTTNNSIKYGTNLSQIEIMENFTDHAHHLVIVDPTNATQLANAEERAMVFDVTTGKTNVPGATGYLGGTSALTNEGVYLTSSQPFQTTANDNWNDSGDLAQVPSLLAVNRTSKKMTIIRADKAFMKDGTLANDDYAVSFIAGADETGNSTRITPEAGDGSGAAATITDPVSGQGFNKVASTPISTIADLDEDERTDLIAEYVANPFEAVKAGASSGPSGRLFYKPESNADDKAANEIVAATKIVAGTTIMAKGSWKLVSATDTTAVHVHNDLAYDRFTEINSVGTLIIGMKDNDAVIKAGSDALQEIHLLTRVNEEAANTTSHANGTLASWTTDGVVTSAVTNTGHPTTTFSQPAATLSTAEKSDIVAEETDVNITDL